MTRRTALWFGLLTALLINSPSFARKKKVQVPTPRGTYEKLLSQIDRDEVASTIADFSSLESRVVGYPGYEEAGDRVYRRFKELGLDQVERQRFDGPLQFCASDLLDAARFAKKLKAAKTPVSEFLKSKLSAATRKLLDSADLTKPPAEALKTALVTDLNALLNSRSLGKERVFSKVALRNTTRKLLSARPTGSELQQLNRLLLCDAFPLDLASRLFLVPVPVETRSEMVVAGLQPSPGFAGSAATVRFRLRSLWPNLVRTNQTPQEGLTGPLVYGHRGEVSQFNGKVVEGSIALLDFNSGGDWFNTLLLGAKAVIFIAPETTIRGEAEQKFLTTPINIPRFWIDRNSAEVLRSQLDAGHDLSVTLHCDMQWEMKEAVNIVGRLKGTYNKKVEGTDRTFSDEFAVVHSFYDCMSVVPSLAPGAEQSCGLAALFQTIKAFKAAPPRRAVLFLASGAHCLGLEGVRHFIDQYMDAPTDAQADKDRKKKERERFRLFATLDLTSQTENAGVFYKGHFVDQNEAAIQWQFSDIGKRSRETAELITSKNATTKRMISRTWQDEFFVDGVNPLKGKNWRTYLPGKIALASEIATLGTFPGIGLVTVNDSRPLVDTPLDVAAHVKADNVYLQTQVSACVLWEVISATNDILDLELDNNYVRLGGWMYRFNPETDYMPSTAVPKVLCVARPQWGANKTLMGVRGDIVTMDNAKGVFQFMGMPGTKARGGNWTIEGFQTHDGWSDFAKEEVKDARALCARLKNPQDPLSEYLRDRLSKGTRAELAQSSPAAAPAKDLVKAIVRDFNAALRRKDFYSATRFPEAEQSDAIHRLFALLPRETGKAQSQILRRVNRLLLEAAYSAELRKGSTAGDIVYAPDRGTQGAETYPLEVPLDLGEKKLTVVLFRCRVMNIFDMIDQRRFSLLREIHVYDAETEAQPFEYGYSLPVPQPLVSYYEPCAIVFAPQDATIKITMGASILGLQFVLINATDKEWSGTGFSIADYPAIRNTPFQVAKDMWALDEHRMEAFRKFGIENARVDRLHRGAKDFLVAAEDALGKKHCDQFLTNVRSAWSYEAKAYPDVQATADDVVKGIMFYLALLLPFAFFAERLFFAFPDIRKQIAGATGIFLFIFGIIRCVHPAFEITITPLIVLLAFVILALTGIVSSIVIQKFEEQMRQIKFDTGGMHSADVGRLSATAAAFSLGISNLRRRKTRTFLTCITLVLLTFTVLSFTSVVSQTRSNRIDLKKKPVYPGILIRDRSWNPLGEPTNRIVQNEYGAKYPIAPRAWYFSAMVGDQSFVNLASGDKKYAATALVGLTPEEIQVVKPLTTALTGRWFGPADVLACIVPSGMAEVLGIRKAEVLAGTASIAALGVDLPVIGILDSKRMQNIKDLDNEQLTPVDYLLMQERRREQTQQVSEGELEEYIHVTPDAVLFVPYDLVMNNGGNLRSIAMNFGTYPAVQEHLDQLMERVELNLYAGVKDTRRNKLTTHLCSAVASTGVKGAGSLFVPILIAAMIVLNTMLGSVYERVHEIGIYSSLGLAPVHIAALFIAESCVFAVLGAVAGYVAGQTLSKLIVEYSLVPGLNLNYSSLSAVASTALIMAVVILSTIYPARKAAQMAVPDVERRWRLPSPEGDRLRVPLPFTVSGTQAVGINAFLKEYMEAHADYSLGHFSADQVALDTYSDKVGKRVRLQAMVWLAPYDLGVSEHLSLETVPTEDEWVNEVHITIRRESGDEASWLRTTRNFLNMVRKQFLIWRTLRPDLKEQYQQTGEELIASGGSDR